MIITTFQDANRYCIFNERLTTALKWLQTTDLTTLTEGRNEIMGDDIFCNVCVYETAEWQNRVWEGHKKYIDIHFMIAGKEYINTAPSHTLQVKNSYDAKTDFSEWEGISQQVVLIEKDVLLIVFPEDIHKTALRIDQSVPMPVRKGIVKVRL